MEADIKVLATFNFQKGASYSDMNYNINILITQYSEALVPVNTAESGVLMLIKPGCSLFCKSTGEF